MILLHAEIQSILIHLYRFLYDWFIYTWNQLLYYHKPIILCTFSTSFASLSSPNCTTKLQASTKQKKKKKLKKGSCILDARLRKSSQEISLFPRSKSRHFLHPWSGESRFHAVPTHIAAAKIGSLCRQRESASPPFS